MSPGLLASSATQPYPIAEDRSFIKQLHGDFRVMSDLGKLIEQVSVSRLVAQLHGSDVWLGGHQVSKTVRLRALVTVEPSQTLIVEERPRRFKQRPRLERVFQNAAEIRPRSTGSAYVPIWAGRKTGVPETGGGFLRLTGSLHSVLVFAASKAADSCSW